ncbi:CRISPR-associated protein Cas2 [Rhizobium grahamii]|uniref:CRISPR-associated protein Cas2 n=1 Tax=Rhizobium grahamii TaxID=1120045 RepID=A0A5Q0C7R5_9HYPH|nr:MULTISPECIES: CRISPR-associated protein Cas2 [Rhizobium]QFY60364.1 CRISPR-associated protein Cas2 [Rhizobium grahamii]QRM50510.1 CRISPR-associated protein Cas2 [Rhizobium sp. BG6]
MTDFLVSYDLIKRKDYQTLWDELERLGAHRTLESLWLVNVDNTAKELVDHLASFVDDDDKLWALELTNSHYYRNARGGTNDWIKNNPPSR